MRSIPRWTWLLLFLSYFPEAPARAQWPQEIVPGARVQARLPEVQFQRGVPSRASNALVRGVQAGAAMALVLVLWNELDEGSDRTSAGTAALVGGSVGFATGALFGALRPLERWRRVRLGLSVPAP